jgi:phosphatidylinositol glycan class K
VIVSSSRYWFNYRHAMNALAFYRILKNNGVPDSQIILMIADEYATNARNPFKNGMYANGAKNANWYSEETEIDYRGADVNVKNFLDATLGTAPRSIQSDSNSSLLIYVSGHGGDQFFKFQDEEEVTSQDLANLMDTLSEGHRFKKALFIADTCQAFTLFDQVETKNVLALGTSLKGENAYAHHSDHTLGLSVIERWTYGFINQYSKSSDPKTTLDQLMVAPFKGKAALGAHVGIKENSIRFKDVQVSDFFGPKNYGKQQQRNRSIKQQVVAAHPSPAFHPEPSSLKQTLNEIGTTLSRRATETKHEIAGKKTENDFKEEISLEPTDPAFSALVVGLLGCLLFAHFVERQAKKVAKAVA